MDYEKAYKDALERARRAKNGEGDWRYSDPYEIIPALEEIFPELRESESEDERIRKALCDIVRDMPYMETELRAHGLTVEKTLAYLEKQKEHKSVEHFDLTTLIVPAKLPKEQKPAEYLDKDKVFAIMTKLNNLSFSTRIPIDSDEYKKIDEITSDVLKLLDYPIKQKPIEWSEEDEKMLVQVFESIRYADDHYEFDGKEVSSVDVKAWLLKSLRPQPKERVLPSLSEKEIVCLKRTLDYLREEHCRYGGRDFTNEIAVLEYLITHPTLVHSSRPHWKPSEQEKGALRTAIHILTEERSFPKAAGHLQAILDAFEGKESRKDWKPSEEQMEALDEYIWAKYPNTEKYSKAVLSLRDDLKKQM